ncbi:MAG: methyltransferase domain-containing protein [Alphaproteobacteria bacterium]|uniref:Methyltransferase domain-containing protein n=1 Tax=Candidatus Nitrobium versatile TaxID=2884831 RepID=A0A953M015_9BACT|nr:methyltransferase domain-containing protein [Candidatus Nitrobium versatile]
MNKALTDKTYWDDIFLKGRRVITYPDTRHNRFHMRLSRLFARYIEKGSRVLEIGCGGSLWLPYLMKELQCEVSGIDYSEQGLKKAEKHLRMQGDAYTLHRMDFLTPDPALFQSFDTVFSVGVIEHFEDPSGIVGICKKFLRNQGLMITIIPNTAGMLFGLQRIADRDIYDRHKSIRYDALIEYHRGNGLEILESSPIRFLDFSMINLHRVPPIPYRVLSWLARMINLPFLWCERELEIYFTPESLSSSLYVVARKVE